MCHGRGSQEYPETTPAARLLNRLPAVGSLAGDGLRPGQPGHRLLWLPEPVESCGPLGFPRRCRTASWIGAARAGDARQRRLACVALGHALLGPTPPHGVRAGIFPGHRWARSCSLSAHRRHRPALCVEDWARTSRLSGRSAITLAVWHCACWRLGVLGSFRPGFERKVSRFEEQGWFSAGGLQALPGQRVRRGTILGILDPGRLRCVRHDHARARLRNAASQDLARSPYRSPASSRCRPPARHHYRREDDHVCCRTCSSPCRFC